MKINRSKIFLGLTQDKRIKNIHFLSSQKNVSIFTFRYISDKKWISAYLLVPRRKNPLPVIIFNRGGNRDYGAITDTYAKKILSQIAAWGYIVLASQYRGGPGSQGRDEFGGDDVDDVLNLFPLIDALAIANAKQIGMYGISRGGMMAYLAITATERVKAAAIIGGVADLKRNARERPGMEKIFRKLFSYNPHELKKRSALCWVEKLSPKTAFLIMHGMKDWRVNPQDSIELADKLKVLDRKCRLVLFPRGDHTLMSHPEKKMAELKKFFHQHLKK